MKGLGLTATVFFKHFLLNVCKHECLYYCNFTAWLW